MSKKEKASLLIGRATYAVGHLDKEHGYNDKSAIGHAVDAINIIINDFGDGTDIDKEELLIWSEELKQAGQGNAYTAAIAKCIYDMASNIYEVYGK